MIVWSWGIWETNASTEDLGYAVDRYDESPGIYYEHLGEVNLFNTEWKTVVYLDIKDTDQKSDKIGEYIRTHKQIMLDHFN